MEEEIINAIKEGVLAERQSVLRMKAVEAKMSPEDFNELLADCKAKARNNALIAGLVSNNKIVIWIGAIVLIALEWFLIFNPHPADGESYNILITLITNFITMFAYVMGIALIIKKKKDK